MVRLLALLQLVFMLAWLGAAYAVNKKMWEQLHEVGWVSYASRAGVRNDLRDWSKFSKHREFFPKSPLRKFFVAIFFVGLTEMAGMVTLIAHFDHSAR